MADQSHVLVPKHVVLSEKEVQALVDSTHKSVDALPIIFSDDPALAEIEVKSGDVIKIERLSPVTQKIELYYRIVVEGDN